jgi:acyl carrier protein
MSELKEQLKVQIIEQLNLENLTPADIQNDMPLFGEELGLDSIDALEFIVLLEQHYGLKITNPNPNEGKDIFFSVDSLAAFIEKNKA